MALSLKRQKVGAVLAARAPLPWKEVEELGANINKGHLLLAEAAMELLTDGWFLEHDPWEKNPELDAKEQFCLVHGVYHAWLSPDGKAFDWAMDMCLDVEKLYWWLCAARRENDLERVVEDLTSQDHLPGLKLMASLVQLSKRAIRTDPRQLAGQVLGRLEGKDLTRHAFMSGARRLLGKKPTALGVLVPKDEISGLEKAGGAVVDVWHTNGVNSVAYSPDGLRLASGSYTRTVRVWDTQTGRMLSMWEGHTNGVTSVAYSPDGLQLASVSWDRTVRIWDAITGRCVSVLEGHTGRVWSVAYSPDGHHLASGSDDGTVRIWDAQSGLCVHVLEGHASYVFSVAYSPDKIHLASASADGTVRVWDTQMGSIERVLEGHTQAVWSVAYSPDGLHLASASEDKTVRIWDAQTGKTLSVREGHTLWVWSVVYSPDGLHLASASDDMTVRIWDTQTGLLESVWEGHTDRVWSVAYSPDGLRVASASYDDDTVRIWDTSALGAVRRKKMKVITGGNISSKYHISESMSITSRDANIVAFTFDNHVHDVRDSLDVVLGNSSLGVSLKIV